MKLALLAGTLVAVSHVAHAADRNPDDALTSEYDVGVRAPAMMHVGAWRSIQLGFAGAIGMRFDRFALLAEGDLFALWPASWEHGSIASVPDSKQSVSGSEQRLGLSSRWAVLRHGGEWSTRRIFQERVTHDLYVDGGLGIERVAIDGASPFMRRDLQVGVGYLVSVAEKGALSFHLGTYYALHLTVAGGAPTPGSGDPTVAARGAQPAAGAGHDIGVSFDFGVAL